MSPDDVVPRHMNVHYLVFRPDSLTYTIAKALSYSGHEIDIWVADPEHTRRNPSNIEKRIPGIPNIKILLGDSTELPAAIDHLIVQVFPRLMEQSQTFAPLAGLARRVTLITAGDRNRPWRKALRLQRQELRQFGRWLGRIDRIAYKDGPYPIDLYGFLKPRKVVGFDVHSQFLHDETAFRAIHALDWDVESPRPILANFLGSLDPVSRRQILDSMRPFFLGSDSRVFLQNDNKTLYWHEYTDAKPDTLEPLEFLRVLSRSDFTLCPPGYSLVTHRPMEALLRGSIPVLHARELDLYDIGLADGVNCIAVRAGGWPEALVRLQNLDESTIVGMRRNVQTLLKDRLQYGISSKRMLARLGVAD
jgi:hypothetical protein